MVLASLFIDALYPIPAFLTAFAMSPLWAILLFATVLASSDCAAADEPTPPAELRRLPPLEAWQHDWEPALTLDPAIELAQYVDTEEEYLSFGPSLFSQPSFQSDAYDTPATSLSNDFTAFPEFSDGIVIVSDKVAMKIGGYIKADLIKDFDAIGSTDSFDTTTIPTRGANRENARFHARQSRLSFDTRWRTEGQVVRAFVEGDFFGGDPNSASFRLRHAYGNIGRFTAGQTWTTFTDPSAVPQTIDFEGAVSNVNRRQGLVRWDQPFGDAGWSWAVALENPQIIVEAPSAISGQGRTEFPDFITRVRLERDWGELQGAYVLRTLGFQPTGDPVIDETGWGFNFTGSVLVLPRTEGYYQITFGDGIGSYRGSPDVVSTGPNSAAVLGSFGWMVGVHHEWTDRLTSNFTFSKLSLEDVPGQDDDNLHRTTYLAINLIANPYERVFCGVEYLHGVRQDVSGAEGAANRLQFAFGFYLP